MPQEGAIQMFQEIMGGMEEIIVGVVGVLQFDVLKYRLENEYNVDIRLENLPYEHIRWIENKEEVSVKALTGTSDMKKVMDMKGNPLLLFINSWSIGMTLDRNEGLVLAEIFQKLKKENRKKRFFTGKVKNWLFIFKGIWYNKKPVISYRRFEKWRKTETDIKYMIMVLLGKYRLQMR